MTIPHSFFDDLLADPLKRRLYHQEHSQPYLRWQLEQFNGHLGKRILEIGCGVGSVLEQLGTTQVVYGIDIDPKAIKTAKSRLGHHPNIFLECLDLTLAPPQEIQRLANHQFDSILCINVLEHIEHDLVALQRMESLLSEGGKLCLIVPAHRALYGSFDRQDGHYRRYSKHSLLGLLKQTSLEPVDLYYFNAVGAIGWWVFYKLLQRSVHTESEFGLMNRLLPVFRKLERTLHPPFGLSLVAICRRA